MAWQGQCNAIEMTDPEDWACSAEGPIGGTEAEAITVWNTRAAAWQGIESAPSSAPRQSSGDLKTALDAAVRELRSREIEYRNPRGGKAYVMDKSVRRRMAAEYADWIRAIEAHTAALFPTAPTPQEMKG